METIIGSSLPVFVLFTLVLFGGFAFLTGQDMAGNWRSPTGVVVYAVLLAAADRFLVYALFEGELLAVVPFLVTAVIHVAIALFAYRLTMVNKMIAQYPWLYERNGLLGWKERAGA